MKRLSLALIAIACVLELRPLAQTAPADTASLRMQYEQWRQEFKTWGRWALFAITFAPLPVEGGTGCPVNPLAMF